MVKRRKIYEGKAKILYEGPEPGTLIQYFKDDATAFNAAEKGAVLDGKGVLNNRISEFIMTNLNEIGVPTHFIRSHQHARTAGARSRDHPARSGGAATWPQVRSTKRLGIEEGTPLPRSIIEFYYKKDELGDPMVPEEHITAFNWASTAGDRRHRGDMTLRINDFLSACSSASASSWWTSSWSSAASTRGDMVRDGSGRRDQPGQRAASGT
jgi:phosphoribosylaminoimidazole-succinocarboxamide synthase